MVSPQLVDPRIEVLRGEAMVEADYLPKQVKLDVLERGADTAVLKEGLYQFDADEGKIAVVDGKVSVTDNGQTKEVGKGRETVLTGAPLKAVKFDRNAEDDLYRWSSRGAGYLAEANEAGARTVYVYGGYGWGGPAGSGTRTSRCTPGCRAMGSFIVRSDTRSSRPVMWFMLRGSGISGAGHCGAGLPAGRRERVRVAGRLAVAESMRWAGMRGGGGRR